LKVMKDKEKNFLGAGTEKDGENLAVKASAVALRGREKGTDRLLESRACPALERKTRGRTVIVMNREKDDLLWNGERKGGVGQEGENAQEAGSRCPPREGHRLIL